MDVHQETGDMQETQFGGAEGSRQRRVIHFTSGETLELDSEEEEEEEEEPAFRNTERKARFSFKNLAFRVGRMSLLTCDFLGERLAWVFGLSGAKYQYAIDRYQRENKTTNSAAKEGLMRGGSTLYGSTDPSPGDGHTEVTGEDTHKDIGEDIGEDTRKDKGRHNRAYQAEDTCLEGH